MRNRLLVLVGAFVISLFSLNVASVQAQPSTVTTSATFSDMLSTFPQAVLSTINSVVLQSTNASSATTPFDSTARKDNLALQMGMWQSGKVGAGVKYWLSELTALRVGMNTGLNLGLSGSAIGSSSGFGNTSSGGYIVLSPAVSPGLTLDFGLSASIEKHLFAKRALSPFLGFGMGVNISSRNSSAFSVSTQGNPSGAAQKNQSYSTETVVDVSANVSVGVEYFVLPSLSIAGQVTAMGAVSGGLRTSVSSTQAETGLPGIPTANSTTISPGVFIGVGAGFSSSLTLSLYFGRNVLGDIVNAFTSGTLFQW